MLLLKIPPITSTIAIAAITANDNVSIFLGRSRKLVPNVVGLYRF
jgi:hypothetical protein